MTARATRGSWMPISNWIVIAIYFAFGLLELWRSDLLKKPEQCRNDGIVEAVSTVLLLTVTQPGIILFVNWIGLRTFPQYQNALAGLSVWLAIPLFLVLEDMMQYWWHRAAVPQRLARLSPCGAATRRCPPAAPIRRRWHRWWAWTRSSRWCSAAC